MLEKSKVSVANCTFFQHSTPMGRFLGYFLVTIYCRSLGVATGLRHSNHSRQLLGTPGARRTK